MIDTKHTATPWRVTGGGQQICSAKDTIAKAWMMRNGEGKANAAFIVRAANSHDQLVAALEDAITRLTGAYRLLKCDDEFIEREVCTARAALAAAEAA